MLDRIAKCIVGTLLTAAAWAQTPAETTAFVAADVHVSPKTPDSGILASPIRNNQYEMRNISMLQLIARAYGMDNDHVVGGPRWLEMDKFDVIAKVPPGTKNEALPPMIKQMLVQRFALEAREDQRPLPGFTLTVGKGKPKLQPSTSEQKLNIQPVPDVKNRQLLTCKGCGMTTFASLLRSLGSPVISSPVVDKTGLEGTFDFELEFTPPQQMAIAGDDGISMFDAVEKLGLKLEQKSTPQPVVVIDRVNQKPTANAPGVAEMMDPPPPPPTIDVSTIKPSTATDSTRGWGISIRTDPQGALIDARNIKVADLVQLGWDLTADRVIGLPQAASSQAFDIVVRLNGQNVGFSSSLKPILQDLLKDRFHFKGHLEDRPIEAYRLVAAKPKMAKADPENRASCNQGPAPGAKDPRQDTPSRTRLYTCRNITMSEFAERLQGMGSGYLRTPVVDATKLEGMWDFTLNFSNPTTPAPGAPAPAAAAATAPVPLASDPSDAISLFEAMTSQLGLKLEAEKRMLPVLVIEHIDDGPTEN